MTDSYLIKEDNTVGNTALAAATVAQVITGTNNVDSYNYLLVTNTDAVDIEIYLNNDTTNKFFIPKRSALEIPASDGKFFTFLSQKNLDGATAETVGAIQFRAQKRILVV